MSLYIIVFVFVWATAPEYYRVGRRGVSEEPENRQHLTLKRRLESARIVKPEEIIRFENDITRWGVLKLRDGSIYSGHRNWATLLSPWTVEVATTYKAPVPLSIHHTLCYHSIV